MDELIEGERKTIATLQGELKTLYTKQGEQQAMVASIQKNMMPASKALPRSRLP